MKKRLPRHKLAAYAATLPTCNVVMESCGSDRYLQTLLINGIRAVVSHREVLDNNHDHWVANKKATWRHNKAVVALANKNVRIIWLMINTGEGFNYGVQRTAA